LPTTPAAGRRQNAAVDSTAAFCVPGDVVPAGGAAADEKGMRARSVVTALVVLTAGVAASAALRRIARRRPAQDAVRTPGSAPRATRPAAPAATPPARAEAVEAGTVVGPDAVVLDFAARPTPSARAAVPARCGDSGGRTKAGAPCGARAAADGRCHHHRLAA
jgi:hypothetical protein